MFVFESRQGEGADSMVRLIRHPEFKVGMEANAHPTVILGPDAEGHHFIRKAGSEFLHFTPGQAEPEVCVENCKFSDESYEGYVIAIDTDLGLQVAEKDDQGRIRVTRRALSKNLESYPALMIRSDEPAFLSVSEGEQVTVGRSLDSDLTMNYSDVSSRHARIGFDGNSFWVEDLGSTNGTYVAGRQISGRENVPAGTSIVFGAGHAIIPLSSARDLKTGTAELDKMEELPTGERFPALVAISEIVKPSRIVLPIGRQISIGRDPASDLWLGSPFVSRKHCELLLKSDGALEVSDLSSNGTSLNGKLIGIGNSKELQDQPSVLYFGREVTVAICFDEDQEREYIDSNGAVDVFRDLELTPIEGVESESLIETSIAGDQSVMARAQEQIADDPVIFTGVTSTMFGQFGQSSGQNVVSRWLDVFVSYNLLGKVMLIFIGVAALVVSMLLLAILWALLMA